MWTPENRPKHDLSKLRYPSDLTDEEWAIIALLIPPAKRSGNRRTVDERAVVNEVNKAPQNSDPPDATAMLRAELAAAEAQIAALEQIIRGLQRARFGQSSERIETGQLALELGCAPVTPEPANDAPAKPRNITGNGQRRRNCGALPAHLERIEEVLDLADQGCSCCGVAMRRIGRSGSTWCRRNCPWRLTQANQPPANSGRFTFRVDFRAAGNAIAIRPTRPGSLVAA